MSAAPGTGTGIPARAATSRASTTRTRSTTTCSSVDLDRAVRRATGDPGLPRARRRPLRPPPPLRVRHLGGRRRLRAPLRHVGGAHLGRAAHHARGFLLCATGCLSAVNRPDIPGIDDFAGEVYYTADWPDDEPGLPRQARRPRRHRIVGHPGGPASSPRRRQSLTVFQRSPNYSVPMPNRPWTDDDVRRIRAEYRRAAPSRPPTRRRAPRTPARRSPPRRPVPTIARRRCGSAGLRAACCSARRSPTS